MMDWLAIGWLFIIAFGLMMYVILDGFTLGIGILTPFLSHTERDITISAILPTWDGNQTWLVFSLAAFYGMFPIGFAYLFPKIYLPAILLAIMLLFRGICFEFRLKAKRIDNWDKLFAFASLCVALLHGYLAGQLIVGYAKDHSESHLIFKFVTAIAIAAGYVLLGSTRLMLKTEDGLFEKSKKIAYYTSYTLFILVLIILAFSAYQKDFSHLTSFKLITISLSLLAAFVLYITFYISLKSQKQGVAYWNVVALFIAIYLSLICYIYPYIVPYELTYSQAKANDGTLAFAMLIAIIMIPLLLAYTGYAYYVFRGKTTSKLEY